MSATDLLRLHSDLTTLMVHCQTVINLRIMGMSGLIPAPHGEQSRMVQEKPDAFIDAWAAGVHALVDGQHAVDVLSAGLAPVSRRVRNNRDRLMQ